MTLPEKVRRYISNYKRKKLLKRLGCDKYDKDFINQAYASGSTHCNFAFMDKPIYKDSDICVCMYDLYEKEGGYTIVNQERKFELKKGKTQENK